MIVSADAFTAITYGLLTLVGLLYLLLLRAFMKPETDEGPEVE
jgi:hypothetical protein